MVEVLRGHLVRLLKIPAPPSLPFGAPGSERIFRAARGLLAYRYLKWGLGQLGPLIAFTAYFYFEGEVGFWSPLEFVPDAFKEPASGETATPEDAGRTGWVGFHGALFLIAFTLIGWLERFAVAIYLAQLVVTGLMVRLDYEYRWYMMTDRSLRIREGLWIVREVTLTFSNIQNVTIRQGPVQRLLGISDLEVQTAGGGGGAPVNDQGEPKDDSHTGRIRGVDSAAEIRDVILDHLKKVQAPGLGDPGEAAAPRGAEPLINAAPANGALPAARRLLEEARRLRMAVDGQA